MNKIIYSIALVAFSFTSCTGDLEDQINDLENELNETKDALANSFVIADAINITHEYSYNDDTPINETFSFTMSSPNYQTISQHSGDEDVYYISIQNTLSFSGDNYFGIYFYYDTDDEEVLTSSDGYNGRIYYEANNLYNDYIYFNPYDSQNSSQYQDLDITVNSIDVETGEISIEIEFDYTGDYYYSEYNTDGKLTATFDGTLNVIESKPNSSNSNISK